ncbi:hypothetical protein [Methylobacterium sp. Leaf85]|uniref:hypothetical protein n=1 Tax=Methylobacterium sp. Leaf85 TaxID=1736241 RepID=UPI0006F82738|nr:hypothetical protein [Methylobacterium sp. Leaf85]KQO49567.1 hypothetical protein ASF08_23145 [Methylobacterium sp. Leaf85]
MTPASLLPGWRAVFALPNLALAAPINNELAALVPASDMRLRQLTHDQPTLRAFLRRFSDTFGERVEAAVLLLRSDAPPALNEIGAIASFRDAIAISAISAARAQELLHPRGHRVLFGDSFAFYPWMVDSHDEHLIGSTPALLGVHDVSAFHGQSAPGLFRTPLDARDLDAPLLNALLSRWRRRHLSDDPEWADIALMRSLNMAHHASLLPAAADTTFYDVGRLISLWVSAFEILVHPGGSGVANRDRVFALLERTPWQRATSAKAAYDTGGKTKIHRTLASWLYQALNDRRNDFLHGNPIGRDALVLPISGRNLFEYAAPLYRLALTAFLELSPDEPLRPPSRPQALDEAIVRRMTFLDPQRAVEDALLTAVRPPEEPTSPRRRRVTRPAPND